MNDNVVKEKLSRKDLLDLYRKKKQPTEHHPSLIPRRNNKNCVNSTSNLSGKIKKLSGPPIGTKRNLESKFCPPNKLVKRVHTNREVPQKPVSRPFQVKHKLPNSVKDNNNNHVENPARSKCKALDEIDRLLEDTDESNIENESSGFCNPNFLYFDAVHHNEEMEAPKKALQFSQADSESQKCLPKKLPADCHLQQALKDIADSVLKAKNRHPGVFQKGHVAKLVKQFEGSTPTNNFCQKDTQSEKVGVSGSVLEKAADFVLASQKMSSRPPPFGGKLLPGFQPSSVPWNQANPKAENVLREYLFDHDEESIILNEQGEKNVLEESYKNENGRLSSFEFSFASGISDDNFRGLDEQCFPSLETIHKIIVSPEKNHLELVPQPKLTEKNSSIVNQNPPLSIHSCEQLVQPVDRVTFSSSHIFSDDSDNEIECKSSPLDSMPPPTQLLPKRRGTPRPSKTPKRKDTFLDLSVDFEQTGSFTASIVRFGKNGDTTVTPVRRSRRLSSTPSVVRKELERFC